MTNKTEIECYFKSADLAALCVGSTDIVVNFSATYPPGAVPVFLITAGVYKPAPAVKKSKKSKKPIPLGDGGGTVPGCPKPC